MAPVQKAKEPSRKAMMSPKLPATPIKHVPQRTCIACRKTGVKRELVRLVRVPDGSVEIDITGKKSGRGAYLCLSQECWDGAFNNDKLEYALRTKIKPENKEKLVNYAKGINNTNAIRRS
jgi:uncharacterized protein